jgi:hypothetical protein
MVERERRRGGARWEQAAAASGRSHGARALKKVGPLVGFRVRVRV